MRLSHQHLKFIPTNPFDKLSLVSMEMYAHKEGISMFDHNSVEIYGLYLHSAPFRFLATKWKSFHGKFICNIAHKVSLEMVEMSSVKQARRIVRKMTTQPTRKTDVHAKSHSSEELFKCFLLSLSHHNISTES